jgi:hypothetical protein
MMRTIGLALVLLLGACASTPPIPANMPPALSLAELGARAGVEHSDSIEATGAPTIGADVGNGDVVISFPYRYKHTAVLTEDVRGYSMTVGGVQAPAGSPGYYAGTFMSVGGPGGVGRPADLWCFLPSIAGGARENICLLRSSGALAAIAPTRMNPYLWRQFAPATGTFDYVHTPIFERRAVEIPGDLRVEYRFERWGHTDVRLGEYAVGRQVGDLTLRVEADGTARLNTVAGSVLISRDPANEDRARVSAIAP